MTKYKVGQKYRMNGAFCTSYKKGEIVTITANGSYPIYDGCSGHGDDLELVTTEETNKRTFRQLKDSPGVSKGALWQEECEDGTQPYSLISPKKIKGSESKVGKYADRSLVEDQPNWFVEVFQVTPQYMTREELERFEAFKSHEGKSITKSQTSRNSISVRHSLAAKSSWTPARRRAHSAKIKAAWAAKKYESSK